MALPEEYLSRPFGSFVLDEHVGAGADAEVFRCVHVPTGLFYALRLGVDEDRLWDGPPLFPPQNGATERKAVHILWSVATNDRDSAGGRLAGLVHVFRIVDARDVVPLSAPMRVRGAWSITDARALPPPEGEVGEMFSVYDDAVAMMYADAALGDADLAEWRSKWGPVSGGPQLLSKVEPLIAAGELLPSRKGAEARNAVRAKLESHDGRELELAENVLVKLAGELARGPLEWEAFAATLRCPFFRLNLHRAEIEQCLVLRRLFGNPEEHHYQSPTLELSQEWLAVTISLLAEEALRHRRHPDAFAVAETEPPAVEDDWLVVQEFAATQPSLFEAVRVLVRMGPS